MDMNEAIPSWIPAEYYLQAMEIYMNREKFMASLHGNGTNPDHTQDLLMESIFKLMQVICEDTKYKELKSIADKNNILFDRKLWMRHATKITYLQFLKYVRGEEKLEDMLIQ